MRISLLLCTFAAAAGLLTVAAQEPALPQPESQDAPTPQPSGSVPPPLAPQLIPDDVLPLPAPVPSVASLPQLDEAFKDNPLSAAAADYRRRIEWRRLRNRVVNDSMVKAALANADAARTDLQKRKLLRRYYEMLFGKMIARASTPDMKAYLMDRKKDHLNSLPQPHVRPETSPSVVAKASSSQTPQSSPRRQR